MINIVCVLRKGGKVGYDASWVEKLNNSIDRHLTIDHRFICLSDCEVNCTRIPLDDGGEGFWSKLQLFKPGLFTDPVFYLDLDTVIINNIDDLIKSLEDQKFVMWYELDRGVHSSAMMYWNGDYSYLWNLYNAETLSYWKEKYSTPDRYGDQALISENVEHTLFTDITPKSWYHLVKKNSLDNIDPETKIIHFRKLHTKPSTIDHPIIKENWI